MSTPRDPLSRGATKTDPAFWRGLAIVVGLLLCWCSAPPEPVPTVPALPPSDAAQRPVAEPEPEPPPDAGPEEIDPIEQVVLRVVKGRSPDIEVLTSLTLKGGRDSYADPRVAVIGADLSKNKALVQTYDWAGFARHAEIRERIEIVDYRTDRRRTVLRWAGTEGAGSGAVNNIGRYTRSHAGDVSAISKLLAEYGGRFWGDDLFQLTPDGTKVVTLGQGHERNILVLNRRGRRLNSLLESTGYLESGPPAISPDSRHLASECGQNSICAIELATGTELRVPLASPGNPLWVDGDTFYVVSYRRRSLPDRDSSFDACLMRAELGESLGLDEVVCLPALVMSRGLFSDPAGTTGAMLLKSHVPVDSPLDVGVFWFRLDDGERLGRRALPPRSEVVLVANGPLIVSARDPDIMDGHRRSDNVLTVLDLRTGDRVELGHDLLGGSVNGLFRTEEDGAEVVLAIRQPDPEALRFELIRIDLASAFPPPPR